MIYDRPYMQSDYDRHQMSALAWILGGLIVAFIAQSILEVWMGGGQIIGKYVLLSLAGIRHGFIWEWLTHGFVHASGWHILGNLLALFFLGRELLPAMGPRRFVGLFFASTLLGGLVTTAVAAAANTDGVVIGSSASVLAFLTVLACLAPDRQMTLLLFFVVPVTLKPKHIAFFALAVCAFCFLFLELPHVNTAGTPPSHLLGGMLAGWLYFKFVHNRSADFGASKPAVELPSWLRKRKSAAAQANYKVNVARPQDIRAEVDRILDKINSQGFGALTEEERRVLDDARDVLNKR